MTETEKSIELRPRPPIAVFIGGFFFVVVIWFIAFLPLIPVTKIGWIVELATGMIAFFWIWFSVELLVWLERPRKYQLVFKVAGIPVAVSFGACVFLAAYFFRDFIGLHFAYHFNHIVR